MKSPSPVISLEQLAGCLLVKFHGIQVAASSHALILNEANYPPVYYIPREDIDEKYFARTDTPAIARTRATPTISACKCPDMRVPTRCGRTKTRRSPSHRSATTWRFIRTR